MRVSILSASCTANPQLNPLRLPASRVAIAIQFSHQIGRRFPNFSIRRCIIQPIQRYAKSGCSWTIKRVRPYNQFFNGSFVIRIITHKKCKLIEKVVSEMKLNFPCLHSILLSLGKQFKMIQTSAPREIAKQWKHILDLLNLWEIIVRFVALLNYIYSPGS